MVLITANSWLKDFSNSIIKKINPSIEKLTKIENLLFVFFFISLFSVFYFPGYWARAEEPPQRSMNILLLVAILGWYPIVALMMNIFNIKQYKYPYIKNNFAYLGLSLFSILLIFVKLNLALIAVDLYLAPKSFQEQQERITAINEEKMKGNKDITLAPLMIDPKTTRTFLDNDSDWFNSAIAKYFGIKSIRIEKAPHQ